MNARWLRDDEALAFWQNTYTGNDDVVALIRGVRAVVALCARGGYIEADTVLLALALEETP